MRNNTALLTPATTGTALVLALVLLSGGSPYAAGFPFNVPQSQTEIHPRTRTDGIRNDLFRLLNEERGRYGLNTLRLDSELAAVAEGHSRDMAV